MSSGVLILNRNFYALEVATWQRAMSLLYLDHAMVVDEGYRTYSFSDWVELSREISENPAGFVHTPELRIAIPEVVALRAFDQVPMREVPFTRRNIYHHYGYRCCYCHRSLPSTELNLDHILPRSRGGLTNWENVVTACIPCNLRKGSRLPHEAGMQLRIRPSKPRRRPTAAFLVRSPIPLRRAWQRFIDAAYWNTRLED